MTTSEKIAEKRGKIKKRKRGFQQSRQKLISSQGK